MAGAKRISWIALAWSLLICRLHFIRAIQRLFARAGTETLRVRFPFVDLRVSADPALAHQVLCDEAAKYQKTRWERRVLDPAMEGGLIVLEGEEWKERRHASANCFGASSITQLVSFLRDVSRSRLARWDGEVELCHEFRCMITESMFRFFLNGSSPGHGDALRADEYARAFERVEKGLESRVFDFLFLKERLRGLFQPRRSFSRSLGKVTSEIERRVEAPGCPLHGFSALHSLIKRISSRRDVTREIRSMLGAGATTGHLLAWLGELLARHPEEQDRLREEILAEAAGSGDDPAFNRLESLPYLNAVIQEGLRLYPPAPYLIRRMESTVYLFSVWAMHRSLAHWRFPDEFRPERWLEGAPPKAFIPFGLGPRVCIGKRFALTEARVVLFETLRRFRLAIDLDTAMSRPVFTVLTRPAGSVIVSPLELGLEEAKAA